MGQPGKQLLTSIVTTMCLLFFKIYKRGP